MDNVGLEKVLTQEGHEDFVEYFIFPRTVPDNNSQEKTLLELNAAILELTRDYIWQKDSVIIKIENAEDFEESLTFSKHPRDSCLCFRGITRFGDNIEDEWFLTWVLVELTKKFPGCVIRVIDNDGEFLLIEAADHLPSWAESDSSCQQRVYLYDGNVHLIPTTVIPGDSSSPSIATIPCMADAVNAVRTRSSQTIASDSVQDAIKTRIGNYPEKILENFYYANLMLPPKLAAILDCEPDLIAIGVNAFYYRDPISLNAVKHMKNFKPGDCLVKSRVRFTKCLYAMLSKQDFRPDPKTGWGFPRPTSYEFKAHSLGSKLTIGFEILLSKSLRLPSSESDETASTELESLDGWLHYLESLKKTGYFKSYLEGSKPYLELRKKAIIFYRQSILGEQESFSGETSTDTAVRKLKLLFKSIDFDADKMKKNSSSLPPDDDDSWMQITADNFDSILAKHFKVPSEAKPEHIPEKLKEFMKNISEFEGIDLPSTSKNGSTNDNQNSTSVDDALDPLDFKADDFVSAMDKLLTELGKPDHDWDASDDGSSYSDEEGMDEIMKKHTFKKDSKLFQLMKDMDKELATTDVGKSFTVNDEKSGDEFDDVEKFEPVNIDINALTNMLKSFQSQEFPMGPATNLLKSVGFDISKVNSKPIENEKNLSDAKSEK